MIYVGEQGNIVYDGSTITEEQKSRMVAIEVLPEPETIEGKVASIRANLETQEVYYVYEDYVPTTEEIQAEEIETLKQQSALQQMLLDDLLLNIVPMLMMGGEM